MKFSLATVVALVGVSSVQGFTAPRSVSTRAITSLDVTTLDQWQLLENGSLVGSVRGHPSLGDGDVITTSPLARPDTARMNNMVATMTGSQYQLGSPMGSGTVIVGNEPGFGRSTFVKVAGTASLFAGGVALGIEATGGLSPESSASIPEVCRLSFRYYFRVVEKEKIWSYGSSDNLFHELDAILCVFVI